jgi:hypothetical protein
MCQLCVCICLVLKCLCVHVSCTCKGIKACVCKSACECLRVCMFDSKVVYAVRGCMCVFVYDKLKQLGFLWLNDCR